MRAGESKQGPAGGRVVSSLGRTLRNVWAGLRCGSGKGHRSAQRRACVVSGATRRWARPPRGPGHWEPASSFFSRVADNAGQPRLAPRPPASAPRAATAPLLPRGASSFVEAVTAALPTGLGETRAPHAGCGRCAGPEVASVTAAGGRKPCHQSRGVDEGCEAFDLRSETHGDMPGTCAFRGSRSSCHHKASGAAGHGPTRADCNWRTRCGRLRWAVSSLGGCRHHLPLSCGPASWVPTTSAPGTPVA